MIHEEATIVDVLQDHAVPCMDSSHHHVGSGWIGVDCPRCSPFAAKWRLGIEIDTGRINCWSCGLQKSISTLAEVLEISPKRARSIYRSLWGQRRELLQTEDEDEDDGREYLPPATTEFGPAHEKYLSSRGFDAEYLSRTWGVRGIGMSREYGWTLFVPVLTQRGRPGSWLVRELHDKGRRYCASPPDREAVPIKSLLYGAHLAGHTCAIVEGATDAWAIGPGAVATLGMAMTEKQVAQAAKYDRRVVCFDSAPEAQERADWVCRKLSVLPGETIRVSLETGDDPASASKEELDEFRAAFFSD